MLPFCSLPILLVRTLKYFTLPFFYTFFIKIFRINSRYMLAEGLGLSGIVSILFTGMVMKHYTFSNLSNNSQRFVSAFFHLLSSLAETFVFIYMGFDIAMEEHSWSHVGFIFFSIVSLILFFIFLNRQFWPFLCLVENWFLDLLNNTDIYNHCKVLS